MGNVNPLFFINSSAGYSSFIPSLIFNLLSINVFFFLFKIMKVTELQAKKRNSPNVLLPHQTSLDYIYFF